MNTKIIALICILLLVVLVACLSAAGGSIATPTSTFTSASTKSVNSSLDGQTLMQQRCSRCHSLNRIMSAHHTASAWQITVNRMIGKGAKLNQQEEQLLLAYLEQNYK